MKKKTVISVACAMATLGTAAWAGSPVSDVTYRLDRTAGSSPFSGALSVGYASNYGYRGLIYDNKAGQSNTPIQLDLNYDLTDTVALFGEVGYTALWDKKSYVNENESSLKLGSAVRFGKGWSANLNYQVTHGGMMGEYIKAQHNRAHSVFQSFGGGLRYDFDAIGLKGFFAEAGADYFFQGNTGWWFEGKVGYRHDFTARIAAVLSMNAQFTSGFYGKASTLADGDQAFGLKLEVPVKLHRHISIVPFVGTWWLGSGANNVNKAAPHDYKLRNFTVVGGANLVCTF